MLLTYWNTASFLTLYGADERLDAAPTEPRRAAERPLLDRWALLGAAPRWCATSTRRYEDVRHAAGGVAAGGLRRRPVELVRPPLAPAVLGRRPGGARDAARVPRDADPAARAAGAVRHRAGVAGRRPAGATGRAGVGAPRGVARRTTVRWSTPQLSDADRPRTPAGRARPGGARRRRRCAPGSRSRRHWWRRPASAALPDELRAEVAEELNVQQLDVLGERPRRCGGRRWPAAARRHDGEGQLPQPRQALRQGHASGRRSGRRRGRGGAGRGAARDRARVGRRSTGWAPSSSHADDVVVTETPREGWAVATDGGETVALDLTLTPELVAPGLAREVVRLVQEARKAARPRRQPTGSRCAWSADGDLRAALREHARRWSPTRCSPPRSPRGSTPSTVSPTTATRSSVSRSGSVASARRRTAEDPPRSAASAGRPRGGSRRGDRRCPGWRAPRWRVRAHRRRTGRRSRAGGAGPRGRP